MTGKIFVFFLISFQHGVTLKLPINKEAPEESAGKGKTPEKPALQEAVLPGVSDAFDSSLQVAHSKQGDFNADGNTDAQTVGAKHERQYTKKDMEMKDLWMQTHKKTTAPEPGLSAWLMFAVLMAGGVIGEVMVLKSWDKEIAAKDACVILLFWTVAAAIFCVAIDSMGQSVYDWVDGFLLEVMLSVDNLFIFLLIMESFHVPTQARNRILLVSVMYCFACRFAMFQVLALLAQWTGIITQVLGVFIAYCAYKVIMIEDEDDEDIAANPAVVFLSKFIPVTTQTDGHGSFFIDGKATAAFISLLTLIIFDSLFAVDSVSAKTAMIQNTYVNFSSSGFAMVMLRAAYFLLESATSMCKYLKYGIGIVLFLIAFVAIFPGLLPIENWQYCAILVSIIAINMAASLILDPPESTKGEEPSKQRLSCMAKDVKALEAQSPKA